MFLPTDAEEYAAAKRIIKAQLKEYGYKLLGWRDVPVVKGIVGKSAAMVEPKMEQLFLAPGAHPAFGHLQMEQQVGTGSPRVFA